MTINELEPVQIAVMASFLWNGVQVGVFLRRSLEARPRAAIAVGGALMLSALVLTQYSFSWPFPNHSDFLGRVLSAIMYSLIMAGSLPLSGGVSALRGPGPRRRKPRKAAG